MTPLQAQKIRDAIDKTYMDCEAIELLFQFDTLVMQHVIPNPPSPKKYDILDFYDPIVIFAAGS